MDTKIETLIRSFFGKRFSEPIRILFGTWLCVLANKEVNDTVMKGIWDEDLSVASSQTWDDLEQIKRKIPNFEKSNRSFFYIYGKYAAIFTFFLLSSFSVYWYTKSLYDEVLNDMEPHEVFVSNGETRFVILPDGSKVWVNAASFIVYPEEFSTKERVVFLLGEARFEVAKNPGKPFIVKTKNLDVEALGTIFDIKAYANEDQTLAILEEGSIRIDLKDGQPSSIVLKPNEQFVYNHRNKKGAIGSIDASQANLWNKGYMIFQEKPLEDILLTIERKYNVSFIYGELNTIKKTYSVKFMPEEKIDDVLSVLTILTGNDFKRQNKRVFINK